MYLLVANTGIKKSYAFTIDNNNTVFPLNINISVNNKKNNQIAISEKKSFDIRPKKIDAFFKRHNAPLYGYGKIFIEQADKNKIDWRIVSAIAWCESNGGKVTPQFGDQESYNAWGWAVFDNNNVTKRVNKYDMISWEKGITIVSNGMRSYYNKGLIKPEEIVIRYTPASVRKANGFAKEAPWVKCIQSTIDKITEQKI